ncbi:EamA/RhaT family transporter [Paracoccus sp. S-4012]|uniref:DMT family transporter n=1 Tax=Paracoccus sp. S-4012 TaxID=2665648 RepID=UPI0012B049E3|nr:DMT family transporter [Paracoccus sp. S-4012]MRX49295.1 EamA/RhaT family transporter [Paracoccus sp. S-4012]
MHPASAPARAEQGRVPFYLTVTGTLLAASILLARVGADRGAPMLWLLVAAMAGAGLAELAIARASGQLGPLTRRVLAYSAGSGLLMALPAAVAWSSVAHAGAGYVAFMHALPILLTWVLARLIGLEGRSPRRLLAVLLGLGGGVVLTAGQLAAGTGSVGWTLAATAIPFFLALGNVYRTRYWPPGAAPIFLAGMMLLGTAVCALPLALVVEGSAAVRGLAAPGVWPVALALVAVLTAQYITYFRLQQAGGPVMLSLIGPVAGIAGPLGAVLLLGERLTPVFPLAAALTFAGVWLMLARR